MSSTTIYGSDQFFKERTKSNILSAVALVVFSMLGSIILVGVIWKHQEDIAKEQCNEIAKNSSYVTKFTGTTCWIRINDGADGVTSEAWIPSEWMTMG